MTLSTVEILQQAKALTLAHPCRLVMALDSEGDETYSTSPYAACWCSHGACLKVGAGFPGNTTDARKLISDAAKELGKASAVDLNDYWPELIPAMFDRAIEMAKERDLSTSEGR